MTTVREQRRWYVGAVFVGALTLVVLWANLSLRMADVEQWDGEEVAPDAIAQLSALERALEDGAAEDMQAIFPEGYVFTWSLYGQAWMHVAMTPGASPEVRERALRLARRAVAAIDTPEGRRPFPREQPLAHGVYYQGWLAVLRGQVILADEARKDHEVEAFRAQCSAIAQALDRSESPFLEAYSGMSWPADTVVAVSALRLHDHLFGPTYERTIARWLEKVRDHAGRHGGLVAHWSDHRTGDARTLARGSSQALILRFLLEIEPELAREYYAEFRRRFATAPLGMAAGFREYEHGMDEGGDIDSGPLILGLSAPATIVGMGVARILGDTQLAAPVLRGVELVGTPHRWGGRKRYSFGLLPVGEAFLVWAQTSRRWGGALERTTDYEPLMPAGWMWRWHASSALLVAAFWWAFHRAWRRRRLVFDEVEDEPSLPSTA